MERDLEQRFLEAYDAYADALYRHCYFRVFSRARAEELTQEAFMKTWQYLQEGNEIRDMRPFLYRVLNNLIIDEARRKKEESLDALMEESDAFEPASDDHLRIERAVVAKEVVAVLDDLPEEYRKVLILRYVDDLDPKEIAGVLGVSANAVSVRIHRALAVLKGRLHQ